MKIHKLYIALGLVIAFGLFFEVAAHADESNQQTKITFSAPLRIPGQVLPAGTYTFERAEPEDDPNVVRIFNADGTVLEAMVQTVSAERMEPAEDTIITLAKAEPGSPDYLLKWFYPGRTTGQEFVYPKQQEQQIAHAPEQTFVGNQESPTANLAGD